MVTKFTELKPYVYVLKRNDRKEFELSIQKEKYHVDGEPYGKQKNLIDRVKSLIDRGLIRRVSVLSDGGKGLGKSTGMALVANELLEAKIPVIEITKLEITLEVINFLADLRNVCIYIDEYEKTVPSNMQSHMLTLFNDTESHFNVWLISGNDQRRISDYLIDRMERITYRLHYDRLSDDEIKIFCRNNKTSKDIEDNLIRINKTSSKISYDTIKYINSEHQLFPDLEFMDLVEILNCQGILGQTVLKLKSVTVDSDKYVVVKFSYDRGLLPEKRFYTIGSRAVPIEVTTDLIPVENKEEEESKEKSTTPDDMTNPFSMGGNPFLDQMPKKTTAVRTVVWVGADNITDVNDVTDEITLKETVNGLEYTIVFVKEVVPTMSVENSYRY